jgi:hypothetical protein
MITITGMEKSSITNTLKLKHLRRTPMPEEDPDLLAGDNLDRLRGRGPYSAMSERFRLTEELENARYENNLLAQKCRELEKENFHLAANQCHSGYAGEHGHHRCSEIDRLTKERDEARLEVRALQKKIGDTSTMLYDWDGYYNPHSQSGNIVEMAKLVEEAYSALQGRSWNEEKA